MIRRRLFDRLPFKLRYELFYQAARSLGIESYTVAGPAGAFAGPMYDTAISKLYLQGHVWPQREINILKDFFAGRQGTLYDIGANIGLVTIALAKAGVSVVAFEPDPLNASLLRGNIARNCPDDARVTVRQSAVYRETATLRFQKSAYNSGDHRLSESGDIAVAAIALDDLPPPEQPFAIKIDTQGAEPGVFEGGQKTIASADMVLSEFWPFGIARMGNKPDAMLENIRAFPYGRLIDKHETGWMSGPALVEILHKACDDPREANDFDFVVAKEKF